MTAMALRNLFGTFLPRALLLFAATPNAIAAAQPIQPATGIVAVIPPERVRLEEIGYRLARANADRCSQRQMLTGLVIHDVAAYSASDRRLMQERHNLTYGFGVLGTVANSPAAQAGIAAGDEIIAVNGVRLDSFAKKAIASKATYERTEKFVTFLDRSFAKGLVSMTIRRGSALQDVILNAGPGCGGRVAFLKRSRPDAWSDGHYVAVTQRMIGFAETDEELAFVVAHEMAHNVLRHAERIKGHASLLAQFGIGAGKIKQAEIEADQLAVEIMARAGYDTAGAVRLLRKTSRLIPLDLGLTHPRVGRRVEIVSAAAARLQEARLSLH